MRGCCSSRSRHWEGGDLLTPGSEAILQVCVPGVELESALLDLSRFLAAERYDRRDLAIARRYDLESGDEEFPRTTSKETRATWRRAVSLHLVHDHQQGLREHEKPSLIALTDAGRARSRRLG